MALDIGARFGVYTIIGNLGHGGMGEVYRARDTRLDRNVAIKILPEMFAADADRTARFRREAKTLAALNHPNIGSIHGLEEASGLTGLVLELIEGPTLAEQIAQGPIPIDEALSIGRQIAEALEAAHEVGIIHRDLKPANIKIRPDGVVKVLDFGLAKALEPGEGHSAADALTNSPTMTSPAMTTGVGLLLGTAPYMSPEQAKGRAVDKRSDVWAFGAVLYEMLTARRAFEGDDVSDTLARILMKEPDWTALPGTVPAPVVTVIRRCLRKDRKQRLRDFGDVSLALEGAFETVAPHTTATTQASTAGRHAWMAGFAVAAVAILTSVVLAAQLYFGTVPADLGRVEFQIAPQPAPTQNTVAISPDGRQLAFVSSASSGGQNVLWVRPLASVHARSLAGSEGAVGGFFWSHDSRFIGFFADGKLKKIDVRGGPAQTLCDATLPITGGPGGTWSRDGVIVFGSPMGILRTDEDGGDPTPVTALDSAKQETQHLHPQFLADGRRFLYLAMSRTPERSGIYVASLDSKGVTKILDSDTMAEYSVGHLVFLRSQTLMAQAFDADRLEVEGTPQPLVEDIQFIRLTGRASFSTSPTGVLIYRTNQSTTTRITMYDRSGKPIQPIGDPGDHRGPIGLSPDGARLVVHRHDDAAGGGNLWLMELQRGITSLFTFGKSHDAGPVWSYDGTRVAYRSLRDGSENIYQKSSSGAGEEEALVASPEDESPSDFSDDGQHLLYEVVPRGMNPSSQSRIWVLPLGNRQPFRFTKSDFNENEPRFSPNGRWVAYSSNETGRPEIYVRPFPATDSKSSVSSGGGVSPQWREDGRELFYVAEDGRLMSVQVNTDVSAFEAGVPEGLFPTRIRFGANYRFYAATANGQRFFINEPISDSAPPITVILNWTAALGQ